MYLESSDSFARTHAVVEELKCCDNWSDEDKETLFEIALSNSQVRYILTDRDVRAFYKRLLRDSGNLSEAAQQVQKILHEEEKG